eukprot:TRINITY_DN10556_c0_g1_i3.p1 TRINITY_DN10556_c0_g1~~TRINITY_DN10556_c0_g1_i3.p1  ORF type:complete len:361 (+),score=78.53 TRINITY_DN10556_c0_g1_i3:15-1097(+)
MKQSHLTGPGTKGKGAVLDKDPRVIMDTLRDSQTLSRINYFLSQKGIPTSCPSLKVELDTIHDQQSLELEAEDVQRLFANFGSVESVTIPPAHKNTAIVVFKDIVSAYFAQQSLHMHQLPAFQARLTVKWNIAEDSRLSSNSVACQPESKTPKTSTADSANTSKDRATANGKYTCRFEIQIANDKEFQVARRLIGPKGCHMKRIVDTCSKGFAGPVQEVIKLRLRGKGSGFKEGPNQQESEEALHLCISSPFVDKYTTACQLCKELIKGVYEEYAAFCEKTGRPKINLQIRMIENVNSVRSSRPSGSAPDSAQSEPHYVMKGMPYPYYLSLIHISEPTRPLYISYAVFCLKKKKKKKKTK